ncbi:MAG: hypothetical protein CM15mP108_3030 [Gammaproteobacteria bacterium]|nr:MAG: hypothetical protein CM15mP108_3030 [Gammaproteobacteria bacterium]
MTHLHLDHIGGIGHLVEKYKEHFVYIHELGIKHLPNPEKLWKAVSEVYTEEWLSANWGEIKPTPINNLRSLKDKEFIDLGNGRKLKLYMDQVTQSIILHFMMNILKLFYGRHIRINLSPW